MPSSLGLHPSKAPADSLVLLNDACTISAVILPTSNGFLLYMALQLVSTKRSTALVMHPPAPFVEFLPCSFDNSVYVRRVAGHLSRVASIAGVLVSTNIGKRFSQAFTDGCGQVLASIFAAGVSFLGGLFDLPFRFGEIALG